MESIPEALLKLHSNNLAGYGHSPMPNVVDEAVVQFIEKYRSLSSEERAGVFDSLSPEYSFGLLTFSERMAILAVRECSPQRVFYGLMGIILEDFRFDMREDLLVLSLLLNSAIRIKADPDEIFENACIYARSEVASTLLQYLRNNKHKKKIIQQMGYEEKMTPNGFDYQRIR
jgi:hypothetical protein